MILHRVKNTYELIGNKVNFFVFPMFSPAEKLLLLLVMMFSIACCWVAYAHGILNRIDFLLYASHSSGILQSFIYAFIIFICFKILWWKATIKPSPLLPDWWPMLINELPTKSQLIRSIPVFIALFIFLSLFSNMKGLISYYGSYSWDPYWAELDRKIHFGIDPWRLLQPILGYPLVTAVVNFFYNIWMPIMVFFLYWQLFSHKHPQLRLQFFYTFILAWSINGTLLAIIFASGGPCYYEFMVGKDYFAELMNYLNEADKDYPIWALSTQHRLLELYQEDKIMGGVGISAMPSMHVATALLFYLLTARLSKWIGYIFAFYFFLILIGSVHLAWHYAVDGYFSIITTLVYWKLSELIIKKVEEQV